MRGACARWNKTIAASGITDFQLKIPSRRFNRAMGIYAEHWMFYRVSSVLILVQPNFRR